MDFFFSSRRRHTRSLCDWSSDVCSSDLSMMSWTMDMKTFQDEIIMSSKRITESFTEEENFHLTMLKFPNINCFVSIKHLKHVAC